MFTSDIRILWSVVFLQLGVHVLVLDDAHAHNVAYCQMSAHTHAEMATLEQIQPSGLIGGVLGRRTGDDEGVGDLDVGEGFGIIPGLTRNNEAYKASYDDNYRQCMED